MRVAKEVFQNAHPGCQLLHIVGGREVRTESQFADRDRSECCLTLWLDDEVDA